MTKESGEIRKPRLTRAITIAAMTAIVTSGCTEASKDTNNYKSVSDIVPTGSEACPASAPVALKDVDLKPLTDRNGAYDYYRITQAGSSNGAAITGRAEHTDQSQENNGHPYIVTGVEKKIPDNVGNIVCGVAIERFQHQ